MNSPLIIADAHVHFYHCFNSEHLLDLTLNNFQKEIKAPPTGPDFSGVLFLAETNIEKGFHRISLSAEKGPSRSGEFGEWTFSPTQENCSLYARSTENETKGLYIIAGRQITTAESLEVLALGTIQEFEEREPLEELIPLISQSGAIPVVPWGVGKWIGRRGALIKGFLERKDLPPFFLGDNRNRPIFWMRPTIFKMAEEKGINILPGSDPLPFPSETNRIGRFGFKVSGSVDPDYPFRDLKKLLLVPTTRPQAYGSLENPFRFFWNQCRVKLKIFS
jgi:hypothetical protein